MTNYNKLLSLDTDSIEILDQQKNRSKFARDAITHYHNYLTNNNSEADEKKTTSAKPQPPTSKTKRVGVVKQDKKPEIEFL